MTKQESHDFRRGSVNTHIYDTIVIGAGGMGSATAYHLAKSGADVLVLEQFQRGHKLGSSHGATRIIRFFYDKPFYTELMKTAYAEWRALESVSGKSLLFITGSVGMGAKGNAYGQATQRSLDAAGVESEWWNGTQFAKRFPTVSRREGYGCPLSERYRFPPRRCVQRHTSLSGRKAWGNSSRRDLGNSRLIGKRMSQLFRTENDRFYGRKVVVTAGAWAGILLSELNLPLTVTRQQVCYYQPTRH